MAIFSCSSSRQATAMAFSPIAANPVTVSNHIDRLSNLPDALLISILSFLSTRLAAQTSILSRRFKHLWEASPSLDLAYKDFSPFSDSKFLAMVDRALLRRDPSNPLVNFRVDYCSYNSAIPSLIVKACSFNLCHLTIENFSFTQIEPLLPAIFSIKSLQSLSLPTIALLYPFELDNYVLPSATSLTRLTTLIIQTYYVHSDRKTLLNQFLSQLPSLQDLRMNLWDVKELNISSHTIRKLKLVKRCSSVKFESLRLSLPLLECLHLENESPDVQFPTIHGEVPLLRKVVLNLDYLHEHHVPAVNGMLNYVSHAKELVLHVKESSHEIHLFPVLLVQSRDPPNFSKLKHLDVTMCFHEDNFRAIVSMFQQCPALESVRLDHESPKFTGGARMRKRRDWKSKLPRNADHNYRYAYFKNLHLSENKGNS